ncbi:glutamine--fructose-6-phosphate transaminase (isomerizing) [Thalassobaculum sp.]|uniref:glutamine--fructose-6-phosphate transaminase (isomerizing) n=1 Tax=Thalassobaculum sp. TaxID=2022740 RepID=UPI0032EFDDAC
MCGIVGIVSQEDAADRLVAALRGLEYRGYDSSGIATIVDGQIDRRRAEGKLRNLEARLRESWLAGSIGIGHTRWATHGIPNEINAHPHSDGRVAVVHNGIIENFRELRTELEGRGRTFGSATDTEVVVHLLSDLLDQGLSIDEAIRTGLSRLSGAYALAILFKDAPDRIWVAKQGSPLAIGYGEGEMFIGSDAIALAPMTDRIAFLENGDLAEIRIDGATITDMAGTPITRAITPTHVTGAAIGKAGHRHFMHKEIYEQPSVAGDRLRSLITAEGDRVEMPFIDIDFATVSKVSIVACGTSFYAGSVARYWLEDLGKVTADVEVASEFRYRSPYLPPDGITIVISQSGETADTLAALEHAKAAGQKTIAIVNVPSSTMARAAHVSLRTYAGPEIGVASTKAFTSQLIALACLVIVIARGRGALTPERERVLTQILLRTPHHMADILQAEPDFERAARVLSSADNALYLARGTLFPVALEGALKLKEVSYVHAEGYAAGEMKHGPIALIDENMPVLVIAPVDPWFDKTAANIQEVAARKGRVIALSDAAGLERLGDSVEVGLTLPVVDPFIAPIVFALPLQLLAYHAAVQRGTDVDQPRNLAKSVTVE